MSSRTRFMVKVIDAKSALNEVSARPTPADLVACNEITYYIVFGPGTSAGAVQIETAHDPLFAGTWAAEGTPVAWSAASKVSTVRVQGASFASRARISTLVVGGTVDVWAMGLD
jgi:hypothetical protein